MPINWGDFGGLEPKSRNYGMDRGTVINRHYVDGFMVRHAEDIRGHVLEFHEPLYAGSLGNGVTKIDIMDNRKFAKTTIVYDLTQDPRNAPQEKFDCIIMTMVLNSIFDKDTAMKAIEIMLKHDGVLLFAVPGICQLARSSEQWWLERWRFSISSVGEFLKRGFRVTDIEAFGNLHAAICQLSGIALEETSKDLVDIYDPDYPVAICARAVKP